MKNILITGGAGFIGCHLCDELVKQGYHVLVLDNLDPGCTDWMRSGPTSSTEKQSW